MKEETLVKAGTISSNLHSLKMKLEYLNKAIESESNNPVGTLLKPKIVISSYDFEIESKVALAIANTEKIRLESEIEKLKEEFEEL